MTQRRLPDHGSVTVRVLPLATCVLALLGLLRFGASAGMQDGGAGAHAAPAPTAVSAQVTAKETAMPPTPSASPGKKQPRERLTAPKPRDPALQATPLTSDEPPPPPGTRVPPPFDPAISAMIEAARADLARRKSVAPDAIELVEVRSVIWGDGSLGCPMPGMAYPQVQVEGLFIRFRAGGHIFDYHSGWNRPPFLCEQKPSPVP